MITVTSETLTDELLKKSENAIKEAMDAIKALKVRQGASDRITCDECVRYKQCGRTIAVTDENGGKQYKTLKWCSEGKRDV